MKSTSISVQGDRDYVRLLKNVANAKNTSLAKLTRQALDTVYGEDIAKAIFFEQAVASKLQSEPEGNDTSK